MLLHLTEHSSESLQSQVIRQIRAKILAGELTENDILPSIRVFSRDNKVSAITIRRSYELLEREGLIHSRVGKGFYVTGIDNNTKKTMAIEKLEENYGSAVRNAFEEGLSEDEIRKSMDKVIKKHRK
ncbi:GntR family transcriptional regulator [candidate division KSB1 bacterium]